MTGEVIGKAIDKATTPTATTNALVQKGADTAGMSAAAEVRARRTSVTQRLLAMPSIPVARMLGLGGDYFDVPFQDDLAEKLVDIPEEHLKEPSPRVAVPAMEGLALSLDEPDLKAMFLNLIARASDDRASAVAHPSFAEVIKQMTPEEASLFKTVPQRTYIPCVELRVRGNGQTGYAVAASHVMERSLDGTLPWE